MEILAPRSIPLSVDVFLYKDGLLKRKQEFIGKEYYFTKQIEELKTKIVSEKDVALRKNLMAKKIYFSSKLKTVNIKKQRIINEEKLFNERKAKKNNLLDDLNKSSVPVKICNWKNCCNGSAGSAELIIKTSPHQYCCFFHYERCRLFPEEKVNSFCS